MTHETEHRNLRQELEENLDREAEILEDLAWALVEHGCSSEPWAALLAELSGQEKRTAELQVQVLELSRRRAESGVASGRSC